MINYAPQSFQLGNIDVTVREPNQDDLKGIENLYHKVAISAENLTEKLNQTSPNSFSRAGGIFEPLKAEKLQEMLPNFHMLIATVHDQIIGFVFCSTNSNVFGITASEISEDSQREFMEALKENKIVFGGDGIVDPEYRWQGVLSLLELEMVKIVEGSGFEFGIIEIYEIIGRENRQENVPSTNGHVKIGGQLLKTSPKIKTFEIGGKIVQITVRKFFGKLNLVQSLLESRLARKLSYNNVKQEKTTTECCDSKHEEDTNSYRLP